MTAPGRTKTIIAATALVLAGFGVGAAVAVTGSASAATTAGSTGTTGTPGTTGTTGTTGTPDPTKSGRSDEHLLTGTTAAKVTAAVKAEYPSATFQRVETDSDGVYEAHIVTSGGEELIVQVGKDFAVTGTDTGGPGAGHGGPDGDAPPAAPSDS
ncbi:MAG: hypothetical protein WAK18_03830 [Nocardioidaceae bacterium]